MEAPALEAAAWLLPWVVQATLVSLVALAALRLGRRWSPRARHAAVSVALLAFAVPPFVNLPWMPSAGSAFGVLAAAGQTVAGPWSLPGALVAGTLLVWAAGALVILGAVVVQAVYLVGLRRGAWLPRSSQVEGSVADAAERMGVARAPAVLCSDRVAGPLLTGLMRPTILLPASLARRLGPDALRLILAHELAHLRQGDLWLNALRAILCALWWPHPLCWILARASRRIREESCDDAVLAAIDASPIDYARTLLASADAGPRQTLDLVSVGALGSGARALGARLRRMNDPRARRSQRLSRMQLAGVGLLCVAAVNGPGLDVRTVTVGDTATSFVHLSGHQPDHLLRHGAGHHVPGHRPPSRSAPAD